jgi:PAS domain S-box-containing protein
MSETTQKPKMRTAQIRCTRCNKLVAISLARGYLEIKCPRCNTLNTVFEKMIKQVIITDPKGKILYINNAAEKASGFSIDESIGKKPSELWGNQMPEEFYKRMWKIIGGKNKSFRAKATNKKKTGKFYDIELAISPVSDHAGNIILYVCIETSLKKDARREPEDGEAHEARK